MEPDEEELKQLAHEEEEARKAAAKKSMRKWMIRGGIGLGLVAVSLGITAVVLNSGPEATPGATRLPSAPKVKDGVGNNATPIYTREMHEYNREQAESAAKEGRDAFLPTPVYDGEIESLENGGQKEEARVAPAPEAVRVKPESKPRPRTYYSRPDRDTYRASGSTPEARQQLAQQVSQWYSSEMASLVSRAGFEAHQVSVFEVNRGDESAGTAASGDGAQDNDAADREDNDAATGTGESPEAAGSVPLRNGELIYAVNELILDSDADSPVWLTVVSGKARGGKLFGTFKRAGERMTLTLNRLVMPGGKSWAISAFAIDPQTPRATVKSWSDDRFFERWAGYASATFLQSFAQTTANSGRTRITLSGSANTEVIDEQPQYSLEDQAIIAAGRVAGKAATIMQKKLELPPRVVLNSGEGLGVLVVSVK